MTTTACQLCAFPFPNGCATHHLSHNGQVSPLSTVASHKVIRHKHDINWNNIKELELGKQTLGFVGGVPSASPPFPVVVLLGCIGNVTL